MSDRLTEDEIKKQIREIYGSQSTPELEREACFLYELRKSYPNFYVGYVDEIIWVVGESLAVVDEKMQQRGYGIRWWEDWNKKGFKLIFCS